MLASEPWKLPVAVRVAATMTTSCIGRSSSGARRAAKGRYVGTETLPAASTRTDRSAACSAALRQLQALARAVDGPAAHGPAQQRGQAVDAAPNQAAAQRADLLAEHLLRPIRQQVDTGLQQQPGRWCGEGAGGRGTPQDAQNFQGALIAEQLRAHSRQVGSDLCS